MIPHLPSEAARLIKSLLLHDEEGYIYQVFSYPLVCTHSSVTRGLLHSRMSFDDLLKPQSRVISYDTNLSLVIVLTSAVQADLLPPLLWSPGRGCVLFSTLSN